MSCRQRQAGAPKLPTRARRPRNASSRRSAGYGIGFYQLVQVQAGQVFHGPPAPRRLIGLSHVRLAESHVSARLGAASAITGTKRPALLCTIRIAGLVMAAATFSRPSAQYGGPLGPQGTELRRPAGPPRTPGQWTHQGAVHQSEHLTSPTSAGAHPGTAPATPPQGILRRNGPGQSTGNHDP